jgi:hypothetical protein
MRKVCQIGFNTGRYLVEGCDKIDGRVVFAARRLFV